MSQGPTPEQFRATLMAQIAQVAQAGHPWADIFAKDLHRRVGGYPGPNHRMPACCGAMHAERKPGDMVLNGPMSGIGASLVIRYKLPRS
jgi:hypothetical protein